MIKRIKIVLIFICLSFNLFAQNTEAEFSHLSMKDGLSMNPVMAISQDINGYLWFGTQEGLNKYDGTKITVFKNDHSGNSLTDNFITSLVCDSIGRLWIGTLNGGLCYFDQSRNKFYSVPLAGNCHKVFYLYLKKSVLFVCTNNGVSTVDLKDIREKFLPEFKDLQKTLLGKNVLSFLYTPKEGYWAGTTEGLFKFGTTPYTLFTASNSGTSLSNNTIISLYIDKNGNIWAGSLKGLNLYNPSKNNFTQFYFDNSALNKNNNGVFTSYGIINNYTGNTIRSIIQDKYNRIWIGTDMELVLVDPITLSYKKFRKDIINPKGINDHFIRCLFIDNSENLWIGTLGSGLNKTDLKQKKFLLYQKEISNPHSLSENYVRAITEDNTRTVWVGTLVAGLHSFNPRTNKFNLIPVDFEQKGKGPNDNNVWSLLFANKKLYIGTNKGLNVLDLKTGKYSYFIHSADNTSISDNIVRSIYQDSKSRVWIGTENGFNYFDETTGKFKTFYFTEGSKNCISDNTVWKIIEDKNKNLWIATSNGLNMFSPETEKFISFFNNPKRPGTLSNNGVRTLFKDKKNQLWIGTQDGLCLFNEATGSFKVYNESKGLPNSFIYSIEEDKRGNLWISTNKGLFSMNTEKDSINIFSVYDGLQDYEFNTNASYKTKIGEMYFGGPSGMNRFNPEAINFSKVNPSIQITNISVLGKEYALNEIANENYHLYLNYDQNILQITFSSLDYTNPERNKYSFILEGFKNEWTAASPIHLTTYTNLDPGEYCFKVKGTNSDGLWSTNSAFLYITIAPPFWLTWWFKTSAILLLLIAVYAAYKIRIKSLQREKKVLEEKVLEKTKDLLEEKNKIETINRELDKLSIVARETDNAILIADASGVIEWMNEGFKRMFGESAGLIDFIGKKINETSSNPKINSYLTNAIEQKISVTYDTKIVSENKTLFIQSTLTPIFNDNGVLQKIVIIDTEITKLKETEEQLTEQNNQVRDSINYALRIQQSILPGTEKLNTLFAEHFILYKPKDIVSGDFYFAEQIKDNNKNLFSSFAVGDCTGHGVPGAFMSLIGVNIIKQSLTESFVNSPADALDYLNDKIIATLNKGNDGAPIRDGMDLVFLVHDKNAKKVYYAAANNSILLVRNNEIIECDYDKQPVGYYEYRKPFVNHSIDVIEGDILYLFTDGYPDQFGGPKGKKLKYAKLKELLLKNSALSMSEQKQHLLDYFNEWKGDNEQIDDVCVAGIKL